MPKYRLLSPEELVLFEKEFIDYLVVNGITADDWVKMKTIDKDKSDNIIDLFSDVILEKVLRRSHYIKKINHDSIFCFNYQSEEVVMIGLQTKNKEAIEPYINGQCNSNRLQILKANKKYKLQREIELFKMIESGAVISDGALYKRFMLLSVAEADTSSK
ncbi:DUF6495 family protein [Saprospiraceae bacterium]|nr:DUF6495 family protein [Saprospiraceae bacterium]